MWMQLQSKHSYVLMESILSTREDERVNMELPSNLRGAPVGVSAGSWGGPGRALRPGLGPRGTSWWRRYKREGWHSRLSSSIWRNLASRETGPLGNGQHGVQRGLGRVWAPSLPRVGWRLSSLITVLHSAVLPTAFYLSLVSFSLSSSFQIWSFIRAENI